MTQHQTRVLSFLASANLCIILSACASGLPTPPPEIRPPEHERGASRAPNFGESLNVLHGTTDYDNDYLSVVALTRSKSNSEDQDLYCSGVLIHPRLVLTAGHCVCDPRKEKGKKFIDKSTCQTKATAATAVYRREQSERPLLSLHEGKVLPHDNLKIVLESQDSRNWTILESQADLAVILLDKAVESRFPPIPIHTEDVNEAVQVTIAGYGAFDYVNGKYSHNSAPTRRFGINKITSTSPDGLFKINTPDPISGVGDSGGPCFRDDKLVGIISSSYPDKGSSITSTYRYRAWINQQLETARRNDARESR